MYKYDELDVQIIKALQANGRIQMTQLARDLGVATTTVRDRVTRLEEEGVIEGYRADVNPVRLGFSLRALVQISVDQKGQSFDLRESVEALLEIGEVVQVWSLTGEADILAKIWARDLEHLALILEKIAHIPRFIRSSTIIAYQEWQRPYTGDFLREG
jgi:DNA-binding Lrp family transcriptional regulator